MTDDNVFRLTMFGELNKGEQPDYTELEDEEPIKQPDTEPERFCGGKGGWDNYVERWH